MKNKNESQIKQVVQEQEQRVETEDVPLYRSYGVTKKVNPVTRKIRDVIAKGLTVILLVTELAIIFFVTFMLAFYTDLLVATVLFIILFSISSSIL